MGHAGAGIALACGKQITHIQSGERVETIGFTNGIYA